MSTARNILLAFCAWMGLAIFALSWGWFDRAACWHWQQSIGIAGLIAFAVSCGLAWRYRS